MMARRSFLLTILAFPGAATAQNIAEVQVAPPSVTIKVGERSGLLATAFDRAGNVISTVRVIWSSNNVAVARVDNSGTVRGGGGGGTRPAPGGGWRGAQARVGRWAPPATPPAAGPPAGGATQTGGQSQ